VDVGRLCLFVGSGQPGRPLSPPSDSNSQPLNAHAPQTKYTHKNKHKTAKVRVSPNPEEVQAHKYVTQSELKAMMAEDSGLLWSPWFR
jgi:hypothetical protein